MTMRNPLIDDERNTPIVETFDPAKKYRYTWPGQEPKTVTGAELNELCKGADAKMLAIEEIGGGSHEIAPPAKEHFESAESHFPSRPFSSDRDR